MCIFFYWFLPPSLFVFKRVKYRSTWVAQLGKHLTLSQVMISRFVGSSPTSGSALMAQSLEPAHLSHHPLMGSSLALFSEKSSWPFLPQAGSWGVHLSCPVPGGLVGSQTGCGAQTGVSSGAGSACSTGGSPCLLEAADPGTQDSISPWVPRPGDRPPRRLVLSCVFPGGSRGPGSVSCLRARLLL